MSSILTAVFKATIGLIVNKGRDAAAERLKDGDVADQKFRDIIVREIEDIEAKLDALAKMYLLAAIDAFETGLKFWYQAINAEAVEEKHLKEISSPSPTAAAKTVAFAEEMKLNELSDKTKRALSEAKKRFKMAREEATRAFSIEALSTFNRVTAIRYRVMATILESAMETVATAGDLSTLSVENVLEHALPECEQCLEKLNSLPDVQNNFKVEYLWNIKGQIGKDERIQIISTVCQVNRAIYDAKKTVSKDLQIWNWPLVDTGEDRVDPLRDGRVAKILEEIGTEHSCVRPLSFGQEGQNKRLRLPSSIATNSDGKFFVPNNNCWDKNIKVFDSNGNFLLGFNTCSDDDKARVTVFDVAADENSNIYVLEAFEKPGTEDSELEVKVFNNAAELLLKFSAGSNGSFKGKMAVTKNKVLVLRKTGNRYVVDVYDHNGAFVLHFGEQIIGRYASDITADDNGRIMMVSAYDSYIHVFTKDGERLSNFDINSEGYLSYTLRIECHPEGKHVVVGGEERTGHCSVSIHTTDGTFVRKITLREYKIVSFDGITVTRKGQIVVVGSDSDGNGKVIVF